MMNETSTRGVLENTDLSVEERVLFILSAYAIIEGRVAEPADYMPKISYTLLSSRSGLTKRKVSSVMNSLHDKELIGLSISKPYWSADLGRFVPYRVRMDMPGRTLEDMLQPAIRYRKDVKDG